MPDLALLDVLIPNKLRLSIKGPGTHPHVGVTGLENAGPGRLSLETEPNTKVIVTWQSADLKTHDWLQNSPGPRFYEETRYRFVIEDLTKTRFPQVLNRDPKLFAELDEHYDHFILTGSFNFLQQAGLSRLSFAAGGVLLHVELEVFPSKLDYATDYQDLVHEISSCARSLALEYLRATFSRGELEETPDSTTLEWLILLRNEIEAIVKALKFVSDRPHRLLERVVVDVSCECIRRPDPIVRRAIRRGLGKGNILNVPGIGQLRAHVPALRIKETLNTPEHRWLRHQLILILGRLEEIHSNIVREQREKEIRSYQVARLKAEELEVASFIRKLHSIMALSFIASAQGTPPNGPPSLTLLNGLGYREAYRAIMVLSLGLSVEGISFDYSLKDLHLLYETWCFIRILQLITKITHKNASIEDFIETGRGGIRIRLRSGQKSEIILDLEKRRLALLYNPTYPGLTGDQKPDVVLEFREASWPRIIIVFDAKYRLRSEPEYIATFGVAGPPIDAVNALHRYRDAIVLQANQGIGRPTVKGVALFPLSAEESPRFKKGKLYKALSSLGVGALPFTPTNTALVEEWLQEVLMLSMAHLAKPGPPFLAWEAFRSGVSEGNKISKTIRAVSFRDK